MSRAGSPLAIVLAWAALAGCTSAASGVGELRVGPTTFAAAFFDFSAAGARVRGPLVLVGQANLTTEVDGVRRCPPAWTGASPPEQVLAGALVVHVDPSVACSPEQTARAMRAHGAAAWLSFRTAVARADGVPGEESGEWRPGDARSLDMPSADISGADTERLLIARLRAAVPPPHAELATTPPGAPGAARRMLTGALAWRWPLWLVRALLLVLPACLLVAEKLVMRIGTLFDWATPRARVCPHGALRMAAVATALCALRSVCRPSRVLPMPARVLGASLEHACVAIAITLFSCHFLRTARTAGLPPAPMRASSLAVKLAGALTIGLALCAVGVAATAFHSAWDEELRDLHRTLTHAVLPVAELTVFALAHLSVRLLAGCAGVPFSPLFYRIGTHVRAAVVLSALATAADVAHAYYGRGPWRALAYATVADLANLGVLYTIADALAGVHHPSRVGPLHRALRALRRRSAASGAQECAQGRLRLASAASRVRGRLSLRGRPHARRAMLADQLERGAAGGTSCPTSSAAQLELAAVAEGGRGPGAGSAEAGALAGSVRAAQPEQQQPAELGAGAAYPAADARPTQSQPQSPQQQQQPLPRPERQPQPPVAQPPEPAVLPEAEQADEEAAVHLPPHLHLGVSLVFLRDFARRYGFAEDASSHAMRELVCAITRSSLRSMAECLIEDRLPGGEPVVGIATVFVSHAHQCGYRRMLDAVDSYVQMHALDPRCTYVWLDIFSIRCGARALIPSPSPEPTRRARAAPGVDRRAAWTGWGPRRVRGQHARARALARRDARARAVAPSRRGKAARRDGAGRGECGLPAHSEVATARGRALEPARAAWPRRPCRAPPALTPPDRAPSRAVARAPQAAHGAVRHRAGWPRGALDRPRGDGARPVG